MVTHKRPQAHLLKLHGCSLEVALEGSLPVAGPPAAIVGAGPELPLHPAAPAYLRPEGQGGRRRRALREGQFFWKQDICCCSAMRQCPTLDRHSCSGLLLWSWAWQPACSPCGLPLASTLHWQGAEEQGARLSSGWATASVQSSSTTRLAASGLFRKASSLSPTPCRNPGSQKQSRIRGSC